jgi:hypothetical protein
MVVIGHSMGGLLTRLSIQTSKGEPWDAMFDHSIDDLDLSEDKKELLKRAFYFEPVPSISRVVFVATPHRGATMGGNIIGRIGSKLISFPNYFLSAVDGVLGTLGFTEKDIPTGIENLAIGSRFMTTIEALPICASVPYHSIIGNKEVAGTPGGTDGVVRYTSSHLEGAVTETIVESGHNAHNHPQAILEIRRILLQHLAETGRTP